MDVRNREALLHQVMDNLVAQVRQWKDTSQGAHAYQDLCAAHKDDIYRFFRDSGLQPWEFHTMLHRASEYGLVEDMKGLWSEVATTFLQMRSGYASDAPQHSRAAPGSRNSSSTGAYGAWPVNGRSSSNGSYAKPPGLEANDMSGASTPPGVRQQQQQYGVPPPPPVAAGPRLPADDTAGSSSDQHSKKQQQAAAKSKSSKGSNQHAAAANGATPAGQQQQRAGGALSTGNSTKPASADVLPNGYISAWRNSMAPGQAPAGAAGVLGQQTHNSAVAPFQAAASMAGSSGSDQQQQQQLSGPAGPRGNVGSSPAAGGVRQGATSAAAGGWELQEPLDLLPSGLLDDVYDQGDAVVDAPPSYAALANGVGNSGAVKTGSGGSSATAAAAPGGRSKQQQQQAKQQRQQKQQLQQPQQQLIQQQQSHSQQAAAIASRDQLLQQQSAAQQQQQQHSQPASRAPLLESSAMNGIGPVLCGPFNSQPGAELTSPLGLMQHHQRPAFESLAPQIQQQQQQFMMLQQQARMYQQQFAGIGAWGAAGHLGYANPFAGVPLQPPPPPRSAATAAPAGPAAAAPLSSAPPSRAPAAAAAAAEPSTQTANSYKSSQDDKVVQHASGEDATNHAAALSSSSLDLPLYQPPVHQLLQEQQLQQIVPSAGPRVGLSLFQSAAYDSPITPALAAGPLSPYPSPLHRSLSSAGASPVLAAIGAGSDKSITGLNGGGLGGSGNMAPMLLPPSALTLGVIGEPVHSSNGGGNHFGQLSSQQQQQEHHQQQQQQDALLAGSQPVQSWSSFGPAAVVGSPATDPVVAPPQPQLSAAVALSSNAAATAKDQQQRQQSLQLPESSLATVSVLPADGSTSSAASSVTAPTATSVATTPHSQAGSPAGSSGIPGPAMTRQASATVTSPTAAAAAAADTAARQPPLPPPPPPPPPPRSSSTGDQQLQRPGGSSSNSSSPGGSSPRMQQQQPPAPPAKPLTWAQKLLRAQTSSNSSNSAPAGAAAAAGAAVTHTGATAQHASGPRIAPAPKSETLQQSSSAPAGATGKQRAGTTGQALLAVAKQQEAEAEAAAAAAVPTYSETAALDGLDAVTAKAAVSAANRMPLPAKVIQAWRSGLCLVNLIKLLQSQRPDLAMALNDRIKGWLTQDCDRVTAECLVLFVLVNLRRDWHLTAKSPGAFLMGLLQHRAALISSSGMARKLLDTARNFPNVAVYIDSDVLQELGDMEPSLRSFIMDEYMCKQRHDWPEGLKFPSQCLLSCMRSIRYADPAVHKAYSHLMETRPDLGKAMNGVILYGLCKCDGSTGLAAVKRLSELPEEWTSAARVNASAFLYQKVQELCGGHCY